MAPARLARRRLDTQSALARTPRSPEPEFRSLNLAAPDIGRVARFKHQHRRGEPRGTGRTRWQTARLLVRSAASLPRRSPRARFGWSNSHGQIVPASRFNTPPARKFSHMGERGCQSFAAMLICSPRRPKRSSIPSTASGSWAEASPSRSPDDTPRSLLPTAPPAAPAASARGAS